jgi:hypothetical protein
MTTGVFLKVLTFALVASFAVVYRFTGLAMFAALMCLWFALDGAVAALRRP